MRPLLFRFDVGRTIGLGHWYRCLALANELRCCGASRIVFLVNPLEMPLKHQLSLEKFQYLESPSWLQWDTIQAVLEEYQNAVILLDTMESEVEYVKQLATKAFVITIGGSGDGRNHAQVRIDGMIPRLGFANGFQGKVLYVGPEYLILRKEFLPEPTFMVKPSIRRVFIALGGDTEALGLSVAQALVEVCPELQITVLVGPLADVALTGNAGLVQICQAVANPRPLMESSDLGITSGGMTTYELLRLGVPVLMLPQNPLQEPAAMSFMQAGVGLCIFGNDQKPDHIRSVLKEKMASMMPQEVRLQYSLNGRRLVDGCGLKRVMDIIERVLSKV